MSNPYQTKPFYNNIEEGYLKLANGDSVSVISGICTAESLEGELNLNLLRDLLKIRR